MLNTLVLQGPKGPLCPGKGAPNAQAQSPRPALPSLPPARRQFWPPSKAPFNQMGSCPVTTEMPDPSGKVRGRLRANL